MVCLGRSDWIVPRRLMCFLFWTGTLLLFVGILLVVTSKHKGTVFLLWGAVLLGLGSCVLLVCLALCVHAYYVIAESRNSAEHTLIDHLQLQRKAQYSAPSCSSEIDGIWEPKVDSFPGVNGREATANSNGHCSTAEFRQGIVPVENGIHVHHHQSFPSGRGVQEDAKVEKGGRKSADLMTGPNAAPKGDNEPITRTHENKCHSSPPNYSIPPPPSYSSQFSPQYIYSSSSSVSKITESSPHPRLAVTPDQDSTSRPGSHLSDERSSRASVASTPSHLKTISSSATSVSRATAVDQAQHQYLHHHSPQPHHHRISDFRNTSSQSSAPNSSTEFDAETTDVEVGLHALGSSSPSGRRNTPHARLHNNTPVNCYQTDIGGHDHDSLLLGRRPPRLTFEPMTPYDSDVDHVDKGESATATPRRITPTIPSGNGAEGVWTTGADPLLARRPPLAGLRRTPGPESITRPFGLGSVTVTPLYRPPKTPPSERHNTVAPGVTVTPRGAVAVNTPELRRVGMSSAGVSARSPDGRTVPTVSVTPCITDREIDISVCQSDVTVYDNVIDNVRM